MRALDLCRESLLSVLTLPSFSTDKPRSFLTIGPGTTCRHRLCRSREPSSPMTCSSVVSNIAQGYSAAEAKSEALCLWSAKRRVLACRTPVRDNSPNKEIILDTRLFCTFLAVFRNEIYLE